MSTTDAATVRCGREGPVRFRWYRGLAHALFATAPPAGILFESTAEDPVPWVTIRPRSLLATVAAMPGIDGLGLERRPQPPPLEPAPEGCGTLQNLVRSGAAFSGGGGIARDESRSSFGRLLVRGDWLGFQTVWWHAPGGAVVIARRFRFAARGAGALAGREGSVATAAATAWAVATGVRWASVRGAAGSLRDWRRGTWRKLPRNAWVSLPPEELARTVEPVEPEVDPRADFQSGHRVVFGRSGAGKTTYLARAAAEHVARGGSLLAVDLHGDLAPAIAERLGARERTHLLALDASEPPFPGVAALRVGGPSIDRAAAHLVAALKRLSPDGTDLYWGFRLERIFDSFVRLVLEQGGSLVDLYALLTDPGRRDAARLATGRPDLARFLSELEPLLRRQPDFLWSAATRLSKVALVPVLAELLAPEDGGLPVEELLAKPGRTLLVRLPFALLGPEAATFAGTLLLARAYLGLAAEPPVGRPRPSVLLVLDEVQGFAPRLVAEILTESRKFGLRALVATQFPDRLAPELRTAVAGSLTDVVAFGVPRRSARFVGEWLGLTEGEAEATLADLPVGEALRRDGASGRLLRIYPTGPGTGERALDAWRMALARTRASFPSGPARTATGSESEQGDDRLLLAVLAAEEQRRPLLDEAAVIAAAIALPTGRPSDPEVLRNRWRRAVREADVSEGPDGYHLTPAGERRVGLTAPSGATRESAEHRRLILRAFRLFACHGYQLEIVRQGRYDTTLPDARLRQLPLGTTRSPWELAGEVERAKGGWAWRIFHGRDVHVEAEVSGALRPDRIRHGWEKARSREAFALFLVGDAGRARRVRSVLASLRVGVDRAQVWTLTETPRAPRPPGGEALARNP